VDGSVVTSRYPLLDRQGRVLGSRMSRRTGALLASVVLPGIVTLASWMDGTFVMPAPAKGLGQHFGYWALFVTTPVVLWLTSHLLESFIRLIRNVDSYAVADVGGAAGGIERLVKRHELSLTLQSDSVWIFRFITLAMFAFCLLNVVQTVTPAATYHHDVFDAYAHPLGFYAAKLYVFVTFTGVYATALFVAMHVTATMVSMLRLLYREDALLINLFAPDNCGGTASFGRINLLILSIYSLFFSVIYAMYQTHRTTYFVMMGSLIGCSLLAICQSILAVFYIHKAVARAKRTLMTDIAERLNGHIDESLRSHGRFPNDLLALRSHVMQVRTYPYASGVAAAVNAIRVAPLVLAAAIHLWK